jgi:inhibitor of cysteine peptidase
MYSKKNFRVGIFTAAILSSILINGCSPVPDEENNDANGNGDQGQMKEVHIGINENESLVQLEEGQILVITLESNPTTGFIWEVEEINEKILQQVGEPEYVPESEEPLPGQGGAEVFRFEAGASGATQLKLVYHQPWEGGEQAEVFIIDVSVK